MVTSPQAKQICVPELLLLMRSEREEGTVLASKHSSTNNSGTLSAPLLSSPNISGTVGQRFRVDYTDAVSIATTNWLVLTTITLPFSPYLVIDPTSPSQTKRFYRAVPLP